MNVLTTTFKFFSFKTLKNVVKILFLLVSLAILLAFHVVGQPYPRNYWSAVVTRLKAWFKSLRFVKCPNPRALKNGKYPHLGQEIPCKSRGYARPPPWGHNIDRCIIKHNFYKHFQMLIKESPPSGASLHCHFAF